MERCAPAVVLLLVGLAPVVGQEKAAVDLKDPSAVALAYVRACRAGDGKAVLDLVAPDDPSRAVATELFKAWADDPAWEQSDYYIEHLFLPAGLKTDAAVADVKQQGEEARVTLHATAALEQKVVLARQPDGTWRVKLLDSIRASTHSGRSLYLEELPGNPGLAPADVATPPQVGSDQQLRTLQSALDEYAGEHDGQFPPADHWMDSIWMYVLDPTQFKCPDAPKLEYGYAMNEELSGRALGDDWEVRRNTLLVFEWPAGTRNGHAKPADLAAVKSFRADGTVQVISAGGETLALPPGTTLAECREAAQHLDTCCEHLTALAAAARKYVREHGGVLPSAKSWQADLAPFLADKEGVEKVLTCPAAPDLKLAYAINAEIAGKNVLELRTPSELVLFFESDLNVPNAAGLFPRDAPAQPRHIQTWDAAGPKVHCVAYVSGSTGQVPPEEPPAAQDKPAEGGKPPGAGQ